MALTFRTSDIRRLVREAMYKKLPVDGEDFPKFMGRRPKSIKARIERIYKRCNEYGLSSQKFHDDAWAAIGHYKRAIESLGYEVDIWVENGGYRDYDPQDNMPRSKQYEIRITADDGMVIEGYIKCMAAGSVQDPFDAYDTMMFLWPKPKRTYNESIKSDRLRQILREALMSRLNESEMNIKDVDGDENLKDWLYNAAMNLAQRTDKWVIKARSCTDFDMTDNTEGLSLIETLDDGQKIICDCSYSYSLTYVERLDRFVEDEDKCYVFDISATTEGPNGYCSILLGEDDPLSKLLESKVEFDNTNVDNPRYYSASEEYEDGLESSMLDYREPS